MFKTEADLPNTPYISVQGNGVIEMTPGITKFFNDMMGVRNTDNFLSPSIITSQKNHYDKDEFTNGSTMAYSTDQQQVVDYYTGASYYHIAEPPQQPPFTPQLNAEPTIPCDDSGNEENDDNNGIDRDDETMEESCAQEEEEHCSTFTVPEDNGVFSDTNMDDNTNRDDENGNEDKQDATNVEYNMTQEATTDEHEEEDNDNTSHQNMGSQSDDSDDSDEEQERKSKKRSVVNKKIKKYKELTPKEQTLAMKTAGHSIRNMNTGLVGREVYINNKRREVARIVYAGYHRNQYSMRRFKDYSTKTACQFESTVKNMAPSPKYNSLIQVRFRYPLDSQDIYDNPSALTIAMYNNKKKKKSQRVTTGRGFVGLYVEGKNGNLVKLESILTPAITGGRVLFSSAEMDLASHVRTDKEKNYTEYVVWPSIKQKQEKDVEYISDTEVATPDDSANNDTNKTKKKNKKQMTFTDKIVKQEKTKKSIASKAKATYESDSKKKNPISNTSGKVSSNKTVHNGKSVFSLNNNKTNIPSATRILPNNTIMSSNTIAPSNNATTDSIRVKNVSSTSTAPIISNTVTMTNTIAILPSNKINDKKENNNLVKNAAKPIGIVSKSNNNGKVNKKQSGNTSKHVTIVSPQKKKKNTGDTLEYSNMYIERELINNRVGHNPIKSSAKNTKSTIQKMRPIAPKQAPIMRKVNTQDNYSYHRDYSTQEYSNNRQAIVMNPQDYNIQQEQHYKAYQQVQEEQVAPNQETSIAYTREQQKHHLTYQHYPPVYPVHPESPKTPTHTSSQDESVAAVFDNQSYLFTPKVSNTIMQIIDELDTVQ
jgi:hypothetical protein